MHLAGSLSHVILYFNLQQCLEQWGCNHALMILGPATAGLEAAYCCGATFLSAMGCDLVWITHRLDDSHNTCSLRTGMKIGLATHRCAGDVALVQLVHLFLDGVRQLEHLCTF